MPLYLRCLFAVLLLSAFFSCEESSRPAAVADSVPAAPDDTLEQLLRSIHAKEKSYSIDTLMQNKAKLNGFNGCVLVAQKGQVIYKKAFGFGDLRKKDTLTLSSSFQLASVSKTLTAAGILLLKEEGKLKLSDQLEEIFPGFPYKNISIHHLLSHRSGLSNYLYFGESYCDKDQCYKGKAFTNDAVLEMMINEKPAPYAAPGKKFEYCNTNYVLLACVIEKLSGLSYAEFMQQRIFKPLGMDHSWVMGPETDTRSRKMTRGHNGLGKPEDETYGDHVVGDKGIYSTVEDLFKWDRALYSEKLLKRKTLEEAFTGYSNERKGIRNYGYGWRLTSNGGDDKTIYHNGWWHGYSTLFFRRPADESTVIILSNKYSRNVYRIEGILSILGSSFPINTVE